jgi:penicillin-binding protein 2
VAQNLKVNCAGGADFYGQFRKCDHHHGLLSIHEAIPMSCDTYFYTLADKLGIDTIARYATEFGLGQKTGIDLPNELPGLMGSPQWKLKNFHERWYPSETISVGIGQGPIEASPLQLARMISGIASNGHFVRPHVVDPAKLPAEFRQALQDTYSGSGEKTIPIDPDTWMTVTEGMAQATTPGLYHTAEAAHLEGIDFAGKTGTAQVVGGGDTHTKGGARTPNAWFVGIVPRRDPELVVAVLQEHGDWGSGSAKLAAQVVTAYVNKKRRQENNLLETAGKPTTVEMGAVWSEPEARPEHKDAVKPGRAAVAAASPMKAGRFVIPVGGSGVQVADAATPEPGRGTPGRPKGVSGVVVESAALPERYRGLVAGGMR